MNPKNKDIKRCDASDPDFQNLVAKLDAYLSVVDGDEHAFYDQYNGISDIKYAVVISVDSIPVGCGAIKRMDDRHMELKRMYLEEDLRGSGLAIELLNALEAWAAEMAYEYVILETGKRQVAAVKFYEKCGYERIDNFPPYVGVENSVCFRKKVIDSVPMDIGTE